MRKIFTRAEIDLWVNYLNRPIQQILDAMTAAALSAEDIKVDEFRRGLGFQPHPDATHGAKFIWQDYVAPEDGSDSIVTEQMKEVARIGIRMNEESLGPKGWADKYPLLFA